MLLDQPNPYRPWLPQVLALDWSDFEFQVGPANIAALGRPADWSVVAYIAANCNLAEFLFDNLLQIKSVGSSARLHLTALFAGPLVTDSFFARLNPQSKLSDDLICRFSGIKSHDPATLTLALQLADLYPAKHRLVFLCGHGNGWQGALLNENLALPYINSPGRLQAPGTPTQCQERLRQSQLRAQALLNSHRPPPAPAPSTIDVLAFDACYMGNIEAVATLAAQATTFVVTEGRAPGQGFPYASILQHLQANPDFAPDDIARLIVAENRAAYAGASTPVTQSALRSAGLAPFAAAFTILVQQLDLDDPSIFAAVSAAMENTAMLGSTGNIDLKEFVLELLEHPLPSAPQTAATAFLQTCPLLELETTDPGTRSRTLSIYAPPPERFNPAYIAIANQLPLNLGIWSWFLAAYYLRTLGKNAPHHPLLKAMQDTMQDLLTRGIYHPPSSPLKGADAS